MNSVATYISEKIKNASDVVINPATEEGLQDIVTAIGGITIPAPVGGATEAKQDTNNQLVDAIYMLVKSLAFLPSVRGTLADLRVTSTGGMVGVSSLPTLSTVSTVTSLTNQVNAWGNPMNTQIPNLMNQTAVNNLRNVIIS